MSGYTRDAVLKASSEYFQGDTLAATTWMNKYALKSVDVNGVETYFELTPEDMHHRLAKELARIEAKYPNPMSEDLIFSLLDRFKYIVPQGGSMAGIGNNNSIQSLSNCFVIGDEGDSYGSIFKTDQELVQLMKRRGGVGTDLSYLRPSGTKVSNAALTSSGAVSFMERYSNSTREVAQAGRRGALMLSMSVIHPDAEAFIDAKLDTTKVTGANVSVKITDEFMKAVINKEMFLQRFPINATKKQLCGDDYMVPSDIGMLKSGLKTGTYYRWIDASKLWDKIVYNAWKSAEPGILFWDTLIKESPADCYGKYGFKTQSTNPCGELPLCPYDSCRLFALNLYSYVNNPFESTASFDYNKFKLHVEYAQRLMDDMVDLEIEKIDQIITKINTDPEDTNIKSVELNLWTNIRNMAIKGRRTGLGVTAEGDMLAALGVRYASDEAIKISSDVHQTLAVHSYISSITLASERGSFEVWNKTLDKKSPFVNRVINSISDDFTLSEYIQHGRRNIANLTLAPTGTTSLMTQTTSGIEPAFRIVYKRRRKTSDPTKAVFTDKSGDMFEEYLVFHHKFIEWYRLGYVPSYNLTYKEAQIELESRSYKELDELIKLSPYYKATAEDIDWVAKVEMQGKIQKWIDHSISCTVNVPKETSVELVNEIYKTAWESGCKGVTIYRDGSRDGVLIEAKKIDDKPKVKARPDEIEAVVTRFRNGNENWLAFIGIIDGQPWEIFTGKIDDDIKHLPKSITIGKIKKAELPDDPDHHRYDFLYDIGHGYINALPDIGNAFNPEYYNYARTVSAMLQENVKIEKIVAVLNKLKCGDTINAWNRGVIRALKKFIENGVKSGSKCPHCGAELVYYNGCTTCPGCGQGGKCD